MSDDTKDDGGTTREPDIEIYYAGRGYVARCNTCGWTVGVNPSQGLVKARAESHTCRR